MEPSLFRYIWRNSRRDQLFVLAIILLSLPFYFASFDVPKRIINDALQGRAFKSGSETAPFLKFEFSLPDLFGGGMWKLSEGFQLDRPQLLLGLSLMFLALVLINGGFKYIINVSKGILGERMLRRVRFELFGLLLRFRPEDIRGVRPAEAASIIKDEVEPIGDFAGDAFIQPMFLGMQAATAMLFILVQSFWLGLVAAFIVGIQAVVIPKLRREQLRLGRERQIAQRKLAGRIGEIVEAAPALHVHGTGPYTRSEIGRRLGDLYKIRADLFRRKFAVKYLNNLLAQITPFFFYSIGGYLALNGTLDIGQLVAVIAAYRDLPPPIKELIDWDQQRADVQIKYQQIAAQFPTERLMSAQEPKDEQRPAPGEAIRIEGVRMVDSRGTALLESMTAVIERPSHVALVGGSGREALAKVLARQATGYQGRVQIGNLTLAQASDTVASRVIAYAGPEPLLFGGTVRENVAIALMRDEPELDGNANKQELLRRRESVLSGNPIVAESDAWLDLEGIGLKGPDDLDGEVARVLTITGFGKEVYRLGLLGRIDVDRDPETAARLLAARAVVRERLAGERGMAQLVSPFDPETFNPHATLAENLLFGLPTSERFTHEQLANDTYARSILEAEALILPLAGIGLRMAETVIEVFEDLAPGHPLFERFSFIRQDELPAFRKLVEKAAKRGNLARMPSTAHASLIGLALGYVEPRYRLQLIDDTLRRRILRARASFKRYLPAAFAEDVAFYDPTQYNRVASIRDNLLFGRIAQGTANAEAKVQDNLNATLRELDLERVINRIGLDFEVGPSGKQLFAPHRAAVALARCLIGRPEALVIDGALATLSAGEARKVLTAVRQEMAGRTLLVGFADPASVGEYDRVLRFDGARYVAGEAEAGGKPRAGREPGRDEGRLAAQPAE